MDWEELEFMAGFRDAGEITIRFDFAPHWCLACGQPVSTKNSFAVEAEVSTECVELLLLLSDREELRICRACVDDSGDDEDESECAPDPDPAGLEVCTV